MTKIQFLTTLLVVTGFLGGVVSVTDKELKDLITFVHHQAKVLEEQSFMVQEQSDINERQAIIIDRQSVLIQQLQDDNEEMRVRINKQEALIHDLKSRIDPELPKPVLSNDEKSFQNTTIEERVTLLEIQVADLREDLTTTEENVDDLDQDINFLFEETIIQDERIFNLEQTSVGILGDLNVIEDDIDGLQDTTVDLDFRVTALEENGGSDGNSSISELEVRVEVLEGTAADHETKISAMEVDVNDLEDTTVDHDTRLTAAEENIQGLQMTDVELDQRVTALEENGGGGNSLNDTIAFHTVLTSYDTIPGGSAVLFNDVLLNAGEGYDSTTGTFTVPLGGDGYYYFSIFLLVDSDEWGRFNIELNGEMLCTAQTDQQSTTGDEGQAACSAASYATEGDTVQVVYTDGFDTTPLWENPSIFWNGFTGFRM